VTLPAPRRRVLCLGALLLVAASSPTFAAAPETPRADHRSWLLEQRFQNGPLARLRPPQAERDSATATLASALAAGRRPRLGLERSPVAGNAFAVPVPSGARLLSPSVASPETWAGVQQQVLAASGGGGCICATDWADLDLFKSDAPDPVLPGGTVVYTLEVTNFGPDKAGAVTVIDALPGGVTFNGVVPGPPVCDFAAGSVTCDLGFLQSGAQQAIQVTVTVHPGATGTILNTASLDTLTFDPITSNDAASAATTIWLSPPGQTPDGTQGAPLRVARNADVPTDLDLSWGASCSAAATDYSIHEGSIGSWYDHTSIVCSTAGALSYTITPAAFSAYYLIVPLSASAEGSYGVDSTGAERPVSLEACRPAQALAACP